MPLFEIQGPNGETFEVEAPDERAAISAISSSALKPVNSDSPLAGIGRQFQKGVIQGVGSLASFPSDIGRYLGDKATQGLDYMLGVPHEDMNALRSQYDTAISPTNVGKAISGSTGVGEANTVPEQYANTAGQFLPGVFMGRPTANMGPMTPQVATALTAAGGSEAAGQASKGEWYEPYARLAGALAGSQIPSVAQRAVTPLPISQERQGLVNTLQNEGVDLTGGQVSGNNFLRNMESELGGNQAGNIMEQQGEQFTAAALRRVGSNANRADPQAIDEAFTRLGQQFDTLAARNNLQPDPQIAATLAQAVQDYTALVPAASRAPVVQNLAQDILGAAQNGLTGPQYQAITSRIGRMARGAKRDPQLQQVLNNMRDALDDSMERSLQAAGSPDAGALAQVRNQYRNLMVVEQAATGAGENAAQGIISPSQLRNATVSKHGRRNYARGDGDFADLARAGEGIMKPLPNSGTAGRTAARNIGTGTSAIMGTLLGGASGVPGGSVVGGLAGMAIPSAIGRALLSRPGRAYLSNQLLAGNTSVSQIQKAIIAALGTGNTVPQSKK